MNGDQAALVEFAQRSHDAAARAADAALKCEQMVGHIDRCVDDLRREMNDGFTELTAEIRQLKGTRAPVKVHEEATVTREDFDVSDTGTYKLTKGSIERVVRDLDRDADAKTWRKIKGKLWTAAWVFGVGLAGFLARHFLGQLWH